MAKPDAQPTTITPAEAAMRLQIPAAAQQLQMPAPTQPTSAVTPSQKPVLAAVPQLDEEVRAPTPRERHLAELAEKGKSVLPQRYDITSKATALRVIYDHNRRPVTLTPGETKHSILLHPQAAAVLSRPSSKLEIKQSASNAQQ